MESTEFSLAIKRKRDRQVSVRMRSDLYDLIEELRRRYGMSQADVIELALIMLSNYVDSTDKDDEMNNEVNL